MPQYTAVAANQFASLFLSCRVILHTITQNVYNPRSCPTPNPQKFLSATATIPTNTWIAFCNSLNNSDPKASTRASTAMNRLLLKAGLGGASVRSKSPSSFLLFAPKRTSADLTAKKFREKGKV